MESEELRELKKQTGIMARKEAREARSHATIGGWAGFILGIMAAAAVYPWVSWVAFALPFALAWFGYRFGYNEYVGEPSPQLPRRWLRDLLVGRPRK